MKFEEMIAALTPARAPVEIKGFKFYVRPLTVSEFGEFYFTEKTEQEKNDLMILACTQDENGTPIFSDITQVQNMFTTVRAQIATAISNASIMTDKADELEKK